MDIEIKIKEDLRFDVPDKLRGPNILSTNSAGTTCVASGNVYKLSDISTLELVKLCEEFRKEVFKKAEKPLPVTGY